MVWQAVVQRPDTNNAMTANVPRLASETPNLAVRRSIRWVVASYEGDVMGKLTAAERKKIPPSKFALPGGRYPVEDRGHAIAAKSRASGMAAKGLLSSGQKAQVDAAANKELAKTRGKGK